jgi:ABC-2 type transport system ATP-binding protein
MEEAQRLCDRVGIIDEGRLVAEGTQAELVAQIDEHTRVKVHATGNLAAFTTACRAIAGVVGATATDDLVELLVDDGGRALVPIVDAAEQVGASIDSIELAEPDLEAVFLHLTGKALRD